MAVDKKSDYYTQTQNYRDLDGMSRSFTFVDHDVKTSIGAKAISEEEFTEAKQKVIEFRESTIQQILALPPSAVHEIFQVFTLRGDRDKIEWDENMLRDPSIDVWKLVDLKHLTEANLSRLIP